MFTHKVVIFRPDTSSDFYYNAVGTFQDPTYVALMATAKDQGSLISEDVSVSSDGLTLERTVVWDTEQSFDQFLTSWLAYQPSYYTDFQTYCAAHNHHASLLRVPA